METYYTEKEKHIHDFLLEKGWSKEDLNYHLKSIFAELSFYNDMPIEIYYKDVMSEATTKGLKEQLIHVECYMLFHSQLIEDLITQNKRMVIGQVVMIVLFVLYEFLIR